MVRLTADLVEYAPQFMNTLKEREIDLRSNQIALIENLASTQDQFDLIDLSDNNITMLDGFPLLSRLKSLFLNNNQITQISSRICEALPNLSEIILTNNNIKEFSDIDSICLNINLSHISLMRNPVAYKQYYREYIIYKLPNIKVIDFQKVKLKERTRAKKLFEGSKGRALITSLGASLYDDSNNLKTDTDNKNNNNTENKIKTFTVGEVETDKVVKSSGGLSKEQEKKIKQAIMNAGSLQEIQRLEAILQAGQIPVEFEVDDDGLSNKQSGFEEENDDE